MPSIEGGEIRTCPGVAVETHTLVTHRRAESETVSVWEWSGSPVPA